MSGNFDPAFGFGGKAPPAFSERESAFYQQVYESVNLDGSGSISAQAGADLLQRSGLPRHELGAIWELADAAREGALSRSGLFLALRLVAHAQAGAAVSAELGAVAPAALPSLAGFHAPHGAASRETSVGWQTELSLSSVGSGLTRPPSFNPSLRERRKYASLFLRTDKDQDGFVEGHEAREICGRSGLEGHELSLAWAHADQDGDGKLSFPEFVTLMHLITCRTRGLPVPSAGAGPPHALAAALAELRGTTPHELHGQRSRSTSRGTSRSASPAPGADDAEGRGRGAEPFGGPSQARLRDRLDFEKPRPHLDSDDHPRSASPEGSARSGSGASGSGSGLPASPGSPRFGSMRSGGEVKVNLEEVKSHLRGVLEADRILRVQTQHQAQEVEDKLLRAKEARDRIKPQTAREGEEARRLRSMSTQLDQQLADAKARRSGLHERIRELRRHQRAAGPVDDGRSALLQSLQDEARLLEEVQQNNATLQQSCDRLADELAGLSISRRELLATLDREKGTLQAASARREEFRRNAARLGVAAAPAPAAPAASGLLPALPPAAAMASSWARPGEAGARQEPTWASTLIGPRLVLQEAPVAAAGQEARGSPANRPGV